MDVNDALVLAHAMGVEVYELPGIEADAEVATVDGVPVIYVRSRLRRLARVAAIVRCLDRLRQHAPPASRSKGPESLSLH